MIAAPTFSQIKAQVTAIRQRSPDSQVIGIHAQGRWTGDRKQSDGDQCYLIDQCDSPLALRIALQKGQQERETDDALKTAIQVLITPLTENELAEDILLRLAKQRLFAIDPWQIVKSLFRATNIDPRLIPHRWLPEALMDWLPANRYSPVMGGFLDAEVVWPLLLQQGLHLKAERPDLATILQWSTDPDHVERYRQAPEDLRTAACEWLSSLAGPTVELVLHCVAPNAQPDALPLGLAAEVVYHPDAQLDKAIGKLEERFLAGRSPQPTTMRIWNRAAQQALKLMPADARQALIQRSDAILTEIGAADFAYLSTLSAQGFDQRLSELSQHLTTLIKKPIQSNLDKLIGAYQTVKTHQQATTDTYSRCSQRVDMALRLAQWLVSYKANLPSDPKSLEAAISDHTLEGSFLDWARLTLPVAEPHRELSTAYGKLFDTITALRETQAYQFAKLLKDWIAVGSTRKSVLPVEQILDAVVAPLAATAPVLLIVMDGMSMAVGQELLSDLTRQHWHLLTPEAHNFPIQPGLATIPSETSTSRASLLCGKLTRGQQNQEKQGFTQHPALLQQCKRNAPPQIFHKATLQSTDAPILSEDLHSAIESTQHQVIGVVINAVDDLLSKGDQVDIEWSCDRIKVLQPLLQAASNAKRLVILTSDHGHVLEHHTKYQSAKGGERWRIDDGQPNDQELQLTGERVMVPNSTVLIAPWTEKVRYCNAKKNGYHGGINPQEMIVPIAVIAPIGICPSGWQENRIQPPTWWDSIGSTPPCESSVAPFPKQPNEYAALGPLFNLAAIPELDSNSNP